MRAIAGALALTAILAGGAVIAPRALGQTEPRTAVPSGAAATATAAVKPAFVATLPRGAPVVATAPSIAPAGESATATATVAVTVATVSEPTATPAPTRSPDGYRSSTAVLGEVSWARDVDPATGEPDRRATKFTTTDPVIYAAIPVERIAPGVTISVTWTYDGQIVPELAIEVTTIAAARPGWLLFRLDRPADQIWPVGGYEIDIFVDGQFALTAEVIVWVPTS